MSFEIFHGLSRENRHGEWNGFECLLKLGWRQFCYYLENACREWAEYGKQVINQCDNSKFQSGYYGEA